MSSWVVVIIGLAIVGSLVLVARKWGKEAARTKILEKNIEAARTRKAIDRDIQNLSDNELADRLRSGM